MIKTFADSETKKIFNREYSKKLPEEIQERAHRKLKMIHAASERRDLRHPPGNHLEKLRGNRKGQSSIKINDQWRICFTWENGDAYGVEITDYH